ncbi:MAG: ABC transporter ATP-binding protein [Desulfobacterales bacterium]|nr:ABC transporter ATP-binding protein [Desulfobacterales bacterium]
MIKVEHLGKTFQTSSGSVVDAVQNISFEVAQGSFYTLLGPSGCGKSTTLRCVAGLEAPESGEITVGNKTVFSDKKQISIPPDKRNIGMVFQSYAIWPHMTVFENVAFPLKLMKERLSSKKIKEKVQHALDTVRLGDLGSRQAPQLSGGQQQRLALARALVREPDIMLLDEPLSNLDAKLREAMRLELKALLETLNITTLYVTHDQVEALAMSSRIAVMSQGKIIQEAVPEEIYAKPSCRFVADFIGSSNFFEGVVEETADPGSFAKVKTTHGLLQAYLAVAAKVGDKVTLCIRPENISIETRKPSSDLNMLTGKVDVAVFLGEFKDVTIAVGEDLVRARLHPQSPVGRGDDVYLHVPPETTVVVAW